jgi:hypothetical protein
MSKSINVGQTRRLKGRLASQGIHGLIGASIRNNNDIFHGLTPEFSGG